MRVGLVCALALLCILPRGVYAQGGDDERPRRMEELLTSRLSQLAILIHHASDGRSRLLIGSGATAWASLSRIYRSVGWGELPHARAYRVSQPCDANLEGVGRCRLLGALFLTKEANIVGGGEVPVGVHLLANHSDSGRVIVVDVAVHGDGRISYKVLGGVKPEVHKGAQSPYVGAWFPNIEPLQDDNPPYRLTLDLVWEQEGYMVRLLDLRPMF